MWRIIPFTTFKARCQAFFSTKQAEKEQVVATCEMGVAKSNWHGVESKQCGAMGTDRPTALKHF